MKLGLALLRFAERRSHSHFPVLAGRLTLLLGLVVGLGWSTLVPRLTLEQMVDDSASVVHGEVVRTWSSWDGAHQFIWTHYEIAVTDTMKGAATATITISEPGGEVNGRHMSIAGVPTYEVGEEVVVVVTATEIGYNRTCGWGQGKFTVQTTDALKTVRAPGLGAELVDLPSRSGQKGLGTARKSLDGVSLTEFKSRLRELIQTRAKESR